MKNRDSLMSVTPLENPAVIEEIRNAEKKSALIKDEIDKLRYEIYCLTNVIHFLNKKFRTNYYFINFCFFIFINSERRLVHRRLVSFIKADFFSAFLISSITSGSSNGVTLIKESRFFIGHKKYPGKKINLNFLKI